MPQEPGDTVTSCHSSTHMPIIASTRINPVVLAEHQDLPNEQEPSIRSLGYRLRSPTTSVATGEANTQGDRECRHCGEYHSDFATHKKKCLKWLRSCLSCGKKIARDEYDDHYLDCKSARECKHCGQSVLNIVVHLKACPKAPTVTCNHCQKTMPKGSLRDHLKDGCTVLKEECVVTQMASQPAGR